MDVGRDRLIIVGREAAGRGSLGRWAGRPGSLRGRPGWRRVRPASRGGRGPRRPSRRRSLPAPVRRRRLQQPGHLGLLQRCQLRRVVHDPQVVPASSTTVPRTADAGSGSDSTLTILREVGVGGGADEETTGWPHGSPALLPIHGHAPVAKRRLLPHSHRTTRSDRSPEVPRSSSRSWRAACAGKGRRRVHEAPPVQIVDVASGTSREVMPLARTRLPRPSLEPRLRDRALPDHGA